MKKLLVLLCFIVLSPLYAQDFSGVINSYLNANRTELQLEPTDISDIHITVKNYAESTRVHHVYTVQRFQGIEIFNSIGNFAIRENQVVHMSDKFISQINEKIISTAPSLSPIDAIRSAANNLGLPAINNVTLLEERAANRYTFSPGNISQENINVKLVFQPNAERTVLQLAWDLDIYLRDGSHWYSVRIDAITGDLLEMHDWVVSCNFGGEGTSFHHHIEAKNTGSILFRQETSNSFLGPNDGSQYRVFAMPLESPNHGSQTLVTEPADPVASPFGWHDTNGVVGPEYTTTRGNNVRARADFAGNNTGNSAQATSALIFDFPLTFDQQPANYWESSTTNLFYWNNILHDVWYKYGFNEASGNFQETNYTGLGVGNDNVNADAQDGDGLNNANFGTPPDGFRPRMQMFLWSAQGAPGDALTINNGTLAGSYATPAATFGPGLPTTPLTADLVVVLDDNVGTSTDAQDGCDGITNGGSIVGKIAVIRRGTCQFSFKVFQAQNAGAVAVIVVNNVAGNPIVMGPGDNAANVTIPAVMVGQTFGDALITQLTSGQTINGTLVDMGPYQIDGDFDNGIIAHEYGHGISNRLTGGAFASGCLQNEDQMGEGWSDWIGLVLTMKASDVAAQKRSIGTFVIGQPTNGNGIRPTAYSTSFTINGATYGLTNNPSLSRPHGIGYVWATMLWDLTWAFIDQYGFDPDFYNGTGGNNKVMQLVIDAMKLQPCSPGFVDGRDAILLADQLANASANRCLIWNVFANRGLGLSASQGSSNDRFDQVEAFDVPQDCVLSAPEQSFGNFSIYPNPSNGNIFIKAKQDMGDSRVTIFDMNGRKVFSEEVAMNGTVNIRAANLGSGVYIIQIKGDEYTHTSKLVIQ